MESLSSFIGVDGTNTTVNSRADPDQPEAAGGAQDQRHRRDSPACSRQLAKVEGIQLFMQPVQDLTVEDRVSRTQYQYSLEDPDAKELAEWAPRFIDEAASRCRNCAMWRATSRTADCRRAW